MANSERLNIHRDRIVLKPNIYLFQNSGYLFFQVCSISYSSGKIIVNQLSNFNMTEKESTTPRESILNEKNLVLEENIYKFYSKFQRKLTNGDQIDSDPIKSMVNDKYKELAKKYPNRTILALSEEGTELFSIKLTPNTAEAISSDETPPADDLRNKLNRYTSIPHLLVVRKKTDEFNEDLLMETLHRYSSDNGSPAEKNS